MARKRAALVSVLGRLVDCAQVLFGAIATPGFWILQRLCPDRLARARHEPVAQRGASYLEHASWIDKAIYLTRLSCTEGLLARNEPSIHTTTTTGTGPEVIFVGDALATEDLGDATFSPALRARLMESDALCINFEGIVGETRSEIAPLFTARGARQLARHATRPNDEPDAGWCSAFDAAAARSVLSLGRRLVVSMANNHTLDLGSAGFLRTEACLRAHGALVAGAGEACTVLELGRVRIGFLALAYGSNRLVGRTPFASLSKLDDEAWLAARRAELRECTHRVALLHWGHEYEWLPSGEQRRLAERLIAHGFCAVMGHHPHVVQPHELRSGAWISYSLGDFVGGDRTPFSRLGVAVALRFHDDGSVSGTTVPLIQSPAWSRRTHVALLREAPRFERALAKRIQRRRGGIPVFGRMEARS